MKLKRMRAMSLVELVYRVTQMIKDKRERAKIRANDFNESLESFVSRLIGEAETIEEKFTLIFTNFQSLSINLALDT